LVEEPAESLGIAATGPPKHILQFDLIHSVLMLRQAKCAKSAEIAEKAT
jgi:hypothetical protein